MKRLMVLSVIMAVMFLTWGSVAPAHAQDSAKDDKPTFYHLVPGTYVNGWPRCTVTYPKEWVEKRPMPPSLDWGEVFRAVRRGHAGDVFTIDVRPDTRPVDKLADTVMRHFTHEGAKGLAVAKDKPAQLSNGTPTREVEIHGILNGSPFSFSCLGVKHGDVWLMLQVSSRSKRIGAPLTTILSSLRYEPVKDEPMEVPPDVQAFLDKVDSDLVSHDVAKVMSHYSERYLNWGETKGEVERGLGPNVKYLYTRSRMVITDFIAAGDRAYLAGFAATNFGTIPITDPSIIKENGEWRWCGNQRDAAP